MSINHSKFVTKPSKSLDVELKTKEFPCHSKVKSTVGAVFSIILKLFGKYQRIEEEGLHWYWPSPVGDVDTVKVKEIRRLELGVRDSTPILEESLMITGDADEAGIPGQAPNIVDVQLLVQYNIKDVRNYLYQSVDPDGQTLKDASETALRQVVGSRPIDDVLTDKKEDVQAETKLILQGLMDKYSTGINLSLIHI